MTLPSEEFLRRFVQHVLPRGFPASATSASSPTADEPTCFHSAAFCSTRLLPRKLFSSQSPRYGSARTAMHSCISSNGSQPHNSSSLKESRHTCLTPPSCQSKAAFTVCFAACSLEVCLRPEYITFPLPNAASRSVSLHRLRLVAENFHSTLHVSSDCLGTSQPMKNP